MKPSKDLYAVHGIARGASQDIRKGHRKLVHEYHPDANPGDLATEERFNEIQHAYEILSGPEQKRQYDESLKTGAGADRRGDGSGGFSATDGSREKPCGAGNSPTSRQERVK